MSLRAKLTLTLEDKLTGALDRLKDSFDKIKQAGKEITLGKLVTAGRDIDTVTSAAGRLTRGMRDVETSANRAWAAVKRGGEATKTWASKTLGPQSRAGAFAAAAEGISVALPVLHYAGFDDKVRGIAVREGHAGAALTARMDYLKRFLSHEALATGVSSDAGAETWFHLVKAGVPEAEVEHIIAAHHRAATAFYAKPEEFTNVTASLNSQFKIPHAEMGQALSAVGLAANLGQMTVPDFGLHFKKLAGLLTGAGMTGRGNAMMLLAMMQTQMLTTGDAGTAAAEMYDGINSLWDTATENNMSHKHKKDELGQDKLALVKRALGMRGEGINMMRWRKEVESRGLNPVEEMLNKLGHMQATGQLTPSEMTSLLNTFWHDQHKRTFWQTQLRERPHRKAMEAKLNAVDPAEANRMFNARFGGPAIQIAVSGERLEQLGRRVGQGFLPVMRMANLALETFHHKLEALDAKYPGFIDNVLLGAGGFLAFAASVALIGLVWPPLVTGLTLLVGLLKLLVLPIAMAARGLVFLGIAAIGASAATLAIVAVVAVAAGALIAAAIHIIRNWDSFRDFFVQMWAGLKEVFAGFIEFVIGIFTFDLTRAWRGLNLMLRGLATFFEGLWGVIETLFTDFVDWIDDWTDGAVTGAINRVKDAWSELKTFFIDLWADIRKPFAGFIEFVIGIFTFDLTRAWRGLTRMLGGLATFFEGLWGTIKTLFGDFVAWIEDWTDGAVTGAINRVKDAWSKLKTFFIDLWADIRKPFDDFMKALEASPFGKLIAGAGAVALEEGAAVPWSPAGGSGVAQIIVRPERGAAAEIESATPGMDVRVAPSPGRILGRI